jgi:hypothetical protein
MYPNIPSPIQPMPHGDGLPVSEPPDNFVMYSDDEDSVSYTARNSSHQLQDMQTTCQAQTTPIIISQKAGSMTSSGILIFQKNKTELLASRLKQCNLLHNSPLHMKLGLMKNVVKALDVKVPAFTYLCGKFPRLIFENVKEGVFIGPQIRQVFKDQQFEAVLSDKEKAAWQSFEKVSSGFLGNFKAANFR